ncbi:MAG: TRAP transporter large permease subunit [Gammaproteobacteria bacterium]|nr:TRAP transporter large permease subunit [Gammaproteobacteria bacterium]
METFAIFLEDWGAFLMFGAVFLFLMLGYPVALTLSGVALMFAGLGTWTDSFDSDYLEAMPSRLFGIMDNTTLIAVPLFVFMGVMLERSKVAEKLLDTMAELFGSMRGGLGISVTLVGALLAASTGIVGATVVTMGLLSLPTMLRRGYSPSLACGTICASGTLGQIIPPSIVLVLLGDVLSSAYQQAQLDMGIFSPDTVSVGDLFAGALIPGLLLVGLYLIWQLVVAAVKPEAAPAMEIGESHDLGARVVKVLIPPLLLILAVLGSILGGLATPTEAASVGAVGAVLLAISQRQFDLERLRDVMRTTTIVSSMVFLILIGASLFSLVFRGYGGDELVEDYLSDLPGGAFGAMLVVMGVMFLLGFVLDFIEITFVVVPLVAPILLAMGLDPVWLGVMIALNLQTSFLTPPFGFALFYLRGVAPPEVRTLDIYKGVFPFILIQLLAMGIIALWPGLATWLPGVLYPG